MKLLDAKSVSYQYPGSGRGIRDFSLEVSSGEIVLINGPSGSGKSTIARCLTGLIPHLYSGDFQGSVLLGGMDTKETPLWKLSQICGMVFQNPSAQMLCGSVEDEIIFGLENLGLSHSEITKRLEESIEDFGFEGMVKKSPHSLSGGEQQRLALAAVMARKPKLLILDEPLSMLDVSAAISLVEKLEELSQKGVGVIIFEHREEFLKDVKGLRQVLLNGKNSISNYPKPNQNLNTVFKQVNNEYLLNVKNLQVDVDGKSVLEDINFQVASGETVAIVGRNGTGKTTLLRTLAGIQDYEGEVSVSGEPSQLGLVFQNADLHLFNPTVEEEILYKLTDPDMDLFEHILEALGLEEYRNTPPLLLSEGEKKRVMFAVILMNQPEHGILLDEPSLGQDIVHKDILIRMAKVLNKAGKIVMMTTHDLNLASCADRIILLGEEGVLADGPTDQVLRDTVAWEQAGMFIPSWLRMTKKVVF